jgi:hypothetical protein
MLTDLVKQSSASSKAPEKYNIVSFRKIVRDKVE